MPHLPDPNDTQAHKAAREGFYAFIKAVWGDDIARDQVIEAAKRMEEQEWTRHRLPEDYQVIPLHDVVGAFEPPHNDLTWGKDRHPLQPSSSQIADGLHQHLDAKFGKGSRPKRRASHQALFSPKRCAKTERAEATAVSFEQGRFYLPRFGFSWLSWLSEPVRSGQDDWVCAVDFALGTDHTALTLYKNGEVVSSVPSDTTAWIKRVREEWEPRKYPPNFIKLWGLGPGENPGE